MLQTRDDHLCRTSQIAIMLIAEWLQIWGGSLTPGCDGLVILVSDRLHPS